MGAEEGILYADCNLEIGVLAKLRHDFAGHYNRPDVFQVHVNRAAPHLYTVYGARDSTALPAPDQAQLPDWRLLEAQPPDEPPPDETKH
jgi:aliphatic nitrilase